MAKIGRIQLVKMIMPCVLLQHKQLTATLGERTCSELEVCLPDVKLLMSFVFQGYM